MKKLFTMISVFLFCGIITAQSIKLNAGFYDVAHYPIGFYAGAEYSHTIAKKLEVTLMSAYLHNTDNSSVGNLEYKHIPVLAGIRYFFAAGNFSPYFSISAGMSSVSNRYLVDVLNDPDDILKGTHKVMYSYSGVFLSYGSSLGTLVRLGNSFDLNFEARMVFVSQNYADFISLTGGLNFRL